MRVGAFLTYIAQLKGVPARRGGRARARTLLERVGLRGTERKRCEELSKGMLQRVQFVARDHPPARPADPGRAVQRARSGERAAAARADHREEHRRGATILFSTHVMAHAEEICQHVVMIHRGRKVLDEPMAGLRRQFDPRTIHFEPLDPAADRRALRALPEVSNRSRRLDDGGYHIDSRSREPSRARPWRGIALAVAPARIELARPRLEDVFIRLVAEERAGERDRQRCAPACRPGRKGQSV